MKKRAIKGRKTAFLVADGVNAKELNETKKCIEDAGASVELVSKWLGDVKATDGKKLEVKKSFLTTASVLYEAVYVPGGVKSVEGLMGSGDAIHFLNEAFKHVKTLGANAEGVTLLEACDLAGVELTSSNDKGKTKVALGVVTSVATDAAYGKAYVQAVANHRQWDRDKDMVSA